MMKNVWQKINAVGLMKDMAMDSLDDHEVKLTVKHRPDVSSRFWWTLEWKDADGKIHSESAQMFDLLFRRAVDLHLSVESQKES